MNEQEKSLKLAELMGWKMTKGFIIKKKSNFNLGNLYLCPYSCSASGKAQFASILLKFPEVMYQTFSVSDCTDEPFDEPLWKCGKKPTQENILDEILRMNGVNV